jgi:hypothetical protein
VIPQTFIISTKWEAPGFSIEKRIRITACNSVGLLVSGQLYRSQRKEVASGGEKRKYHCFTFCAIGMQRLWILPPPGCWCKRKILNTM